MIDAALGHIAGQLNQHFRRSFQVPEDLVVLSNLHEQSGAQAPAVNNKLVLFLCGIERDTAAHRMPERGDVRQPTTLQRNPPIFLNLMVICAANFSGGNYTEALKFLSSAIAYFQSMPMFDHHNSRDMDTRLERLVLNIENLNNNEMNSLWSIHGGHYLPSVLYRVRMVALDGNAVIGRSSTVRETQVEALP